MQPILNTGPTIKEELKARRIKNRDLARELGVSETVVSFVIRGMTCSDRVQKAIAEKLGRAPEELFPEYYSRHAKKLTKASEEEKQEEVKEG
jgi:transcriptional regulator with XRE-family HTH domain